MTAVVAAALLAGCAGASAPKGATPTTTRSSGIAVANAPSGTVWLCRPGADPDPCAGDLTTTIEQADGTKSVMARSDATNPPVDCFYVYPTVSGEKSINADLTVGPAEVAVARAQAAPFSQVCRVFAPMYRQVTLSSLFPYSVEAQYDGIAYDDVQNAWLDYLAHYNHGRRVVLIGHSQGTVMLIGLIHREIDPSPAQRHLLLSALLAGGNVQVPVGRLVGGSFTQVPLCTTSTETGCAVAWSTFLEQPPADSLFGRPGSGVSLMDTAVGVPSPAAGQQVACVNPADPAAGEAPLIPMMPGSATAGWVQYPGLYSGQCQSSGGATWLQVSVHHPSSDPRPVVTEAQGAIWGLHVEDINIAVGSLVDLVRVESGQARSSP